MPNWCENSLLVIGGREDVKRFYEKGFEKSSENVNGEWCLFPYYPYEGEWDYDWCVDNWGTKWDVDCTIYDLIEIDTEFCVEFNSAWAPPIAWLKKVQSDYPNLKFKLLYEEPGMQFVGMSYSEMIDDKLIIVDYCEEVKEWENDCSEKVEYDKANDVWINVLTGEKEEEDYSPYIRNHFKDYTLWFENNKAA